MWTLCCNWHCTNYKKTNEKTTLCLPAQAICVDSKRNPAAQPISMWMRRFMIFAPIHEIRKWAYCYIALICLRPWTRFTQAIFSAMRWYLICHYLSHTRYSLVSPLEISSFAMQFRNAKFGFFEYLWVNTHSLLHAHHEPSKFPTKPLCLEICRSIGELGEQLPKWIGWKVTKLDGLSAQILQFN